MSSPNKSITAAPSPQSPPSASRAHVATVFDPLPGIAPAPITVDIAGHVYTIPAMMAGEWLTTLTGAGWLQRWRFEPDPERDPDGIGAAALVDAWTGGPRQTWRLYAALDDGDITPIGLARAARQVWARAAGVDWWVAERLAVQSVSWVGIGGLLYERGLRPGEVPLPVWLAGAYRAWMQVTRSEDRVNLDSAIQLPPAGYDAGRPAASLWDIFTP